MASALSKDARQAATRLAHDVGKYVARTARNLPSEDASPLPAALHAMLLSDLYGDAQKPQDRPSMQFARLAAGLTDARIADAQADFAALDALESEVRANRPAAVSRAAALARHIDESLRDFAKLFARSAGKPDNKKTTR